MEVFLFEFRNSWYGFPEVWHPAHVGRDWIWSHGGCLRGWMSQNSPRGTCPQLRLRFRLPWVGFLFVLLRLPHNLLINYYQIPIWLFHFIISFDYSVWLFHLIIPFYYFIWLFRLIISFDYFIWLLHLLMCFYKLCLLYLSTFNGFIVYIHVRACFLSTHEA